jgi:hypothetical protein
MIDQDLSKKIINLEEQYWQAMGDNDVEVALSLTQFPCLITGSRGAHRIGKNEYRKMMESQDMSQYKDSQLKNAKVDKITDNVAVITYSVHHNKKDMLDISTWVQEGNQWKCAVHTENPLMP